MKFVNLQFGIFNFIDSLNFFTHTNLETLINSVANREEKSRPDGTTYWDCSKEDLSVSKMKSEALKLLYPNIPTSVFDITTKKGKIPYDYLKPERLKENCLPALEYWHDELYDEDISLQDLNDYQEIFTLTREQRKSTQRMWVSCFSSIRKR